MGFWTLQHFPVGGPMVEKHFGDQANGQPYWNIVSAKLSRVSLHPSNLAAIVVQPYDATLSFDYGDKVIIWRNRTSIGNGGSIYFVGFVGNPRRQASGKEEMIHYTFYCPMYLMGQMTFEQKLTAWSLQPNTTHVVLNLDMSGRFGRGVGAPCTVANQLQAILDDAITQGANFQYAVGELPNAVVDGVTLFPPVDEKRDITHTEALKAELRWVPDSVPYFDFTQDPPFLHFARRATMAATTVDAADKSFVLVSGDVIPRDDLQVTQVILRYEQTSTVNGQAVIGIFLDQFPAGKTSPVSMRGTISLQGLQATDQTVELQCRDMSFINSTNGTGDDGVQRNFPFWCEKHPWLINVTNLDVHDIQRSGSLQFEHIDGNIASWMTTNNQSGGPQVVEVHELVTALADFTDEIGQQFVDQPLQVRVRTTNGAPGTYNRLKITQVAEPIPVGLAKWFYLIVSILQYEGTFRITSSEVSATQFLGKVVNIINGAPDWAVMNALVTAVTEDIFTGAVTVTLGPNKYLHPGELLDMLRVTRNRLVTVYVGSIANAVTDNSNVDLGGNLPRENSTVSTPKPSKHIVKFLDDTQDPPVTTTITHDSTIGMITMQTDDPTDPQVIISLDDLSAV